MNKVSITISVYKNDDMYFFHHHFFSNLNVDYNEDKSLLYDYLHKVDSLINPKQSFFSVLQVLVSTAFVDNTSEFTFKDLHKNVYRLTAGVIID